MSDAFIATFSITFLVGFGLFGWGVFLLCRSKAAAAWPTTQGEILECDLIETPCGDDSSWKTKVRYRYACNGREFIGTRIAFGYTNSKSREDHSLIATKLRSRAKVQVWYQPNAPANAVLAVGFHHHANPFLGMGAAIQLLAGFLLVGHALLLLMAALFAMLLLNLARWEQIDAKIQPVE